ncbi:sensor histidine kinase [Eggerthella guodeyinii]|uniref:GHKL domain-containing protein n=1 Tax=Eggerthella guodeyinii TaxID=2690837 RepID=A0A6N7RNQ4_9ACTN|nr:sensor histidine kinase [Eggerthella guodeyinii]MRX82909.1 GHKL domain-containing protein [Eggerthella guodeyinii]
MEDMHFEVSAKMARLIGRENITDVDSAIIELIKNSYDADATCVCLGFCMPFPAVPKEIDFVLAQQALDIEKRIALLDFYDRRESSYVMKEGLSVEQHEALQKLLFSANVIVVADNGCGMDRGTLRSAWMNIGTDDKVENRVSLGGRVKTGAKGIGRFALDKLSTVTTVYTKKKTDSLLRWGIDWGQFEKATLLNEVTATIETLEGEFECYVKQCIGKKIASFDEYDWNSGTLISLQPTREPWSQQYFEKVNKNLKSIFPDRNDLKFDIYVHNEYFPQYTALNERFSLGKSEYDYKVLASFDGVDTLQISMHRNEIITRKRTACIEVYGKKTEVPLSEFWKRDAFQKVGYERASFSKTVTMRFSAQDLLKIPASSLKDVGAFSLELFFLKNTPSTLDIVNPVVKARRKELLKDYSGVKLYRDGFKVRPYGEEGASFDWLKLGDRSVRSPAAPSHDTGRWRVRPNQLIGAVRITHAGNPNLEDMANREGLAMNDAYDTFVMVIDKVIDIFESDRQYPLREYALWRKKKGIELSKTEEIREGIAASGRKSNEKDSGAAHDEWRDKRSKREYTKEEYERAVAEIEDERLRQQRATKTMMLFSSAGVMTNTFSHEISRIAAEIGSRMQRLRVAVRRIVGTAGYKGDSDFDPFVLIEEAEKTDRLLEDWLRITMEGTGDEAFAETQIYPAEILQKIIELWQPMLEKKYIVVNELTKLNVTETSTLRAAVVDFYIIMNNFFLNSAWFLEKAETARREITITISDGGDKFVLLLENNGPPLDPSLLGNPDSIFEAGVTTKEQGDKKGTGLGLWIMKFVVENNSGEIHTISQSDGFGLRISFPK